MSPIDERLKSLNIVLPDVMPPVVDGYVPAFAPFIRSGDQMHLSGRLGKKDGTQLVSTAVASGENQWASVRSIARNTRCRNIRADAIVALPWA
jgi:hypothetical protein